MYLLIGILWETIIVTRKEYLRKCLFDKAVSQNCFIEFHNEYIVTIVRAVVNLQMRVLTIRGVQCCDNGRVFSVKTRGPAV